MLRLRSVAQKNHDIRRKLVRLLFLMLAILGLPDAASTAKQTQITPVGRHPRVGGDPFFLSAKREARWIPACAGMTVAVLVLMLANNAVAAQKPKQPVAPVTQSTPVESAHLQKCLKRADDFPDIAAVEAGAWIKNNGGDEAHLCRAFAQTNRGMHADAAREFWALASRFKKQQPARAATMNVLSGQEFLRAKDTKNAEAQFTTALNLMPTNATAFVGRAQVRMVMEKYWDALDDLNRALKLTPNDAEALRQRGRAWLQLGNDKNAQDDFEHAAALTPAVPAP